MKNKGEPLQQRRPRLNTVDGDKCIFKKIQNLENKLKIARQARMNEIQN